MARSSALPVVLLALLAAASFASFASGCSGCDKPADNAVDAAAATSATPASSSAAVVDADATAPEAGATVDRTFRGMHRGAPGAMLFPAARALELPPETKTKIDEADKLAAPPGEAGMQARQATKDLHAELVSEIKAGKIEPAKLEPKYQAIEKIAAGDRDKEAASLNALYAALDAAQRKAVVANVRGTQAKRDEARAAHTKDGGAPDGGAMAGAGKRSLERLTRGLELDADQQKKVDGIAPKDDPKSNVDPAEMKKRLETLLTAFEKDGGFDAKKVDGYDPKRARVALEGETKLVTQLLPILKPEQREKLAAKMDRGPFPGPMMGPRGGRRGMGHRPLAEPEDDEP